MLYNLQSQQEVPETSVTVYRNGRLDCHQKNSHWRMTLSCTRVVDRRRWRLRKQLTGDVCCIVWRQESGRRNQHNESRVIGHSHASTTRQIAVPTSYLRQKVKREDSDQLPVHNSVIIPTSYLSRNCFAFWKKPPKAKEFVFDCFQLNWHYNHCTCNEYYTPCPKKVPPNSRR